MILLVKWASKIPSWKVSYDIQALKWSIWDYGPILRFFTEIPQFHVKCWKLPNTNISVRDVENWHPGHRKMQVYWFASIILSKIALIGLQGVKWWIWAFFTLLRFLTLMEWICANTVGRSKNLCYENVKKTWGFALVNKKLEKNWKKTQFW